MGLLHLRPKSCNFGRSCPIHRTECCARSLFSLASQDPSAVTPEKERQEGCSKAGGKKAKQRLALEAMKIALVSQQKLVEVRVSSLSRMFRRPTSS